MFKSLKYRIARYVLTHAFDWFDMLQAFCLKVIAKNASPVEFVAAANVALRPFGKEIVTKKKESKAPSDEGLERLLAQLDSMYPTHRPN